MRFWKRDSRPGAEEAAARLLVLKHVIVYAFIAPPRDMLGEMMAGWSDEDRRQFASDSAKSRDEYWSRLDLPGIRGALSPREREYARSTAVTMTHQQQLDASWRMEAAQVLMWSLSLVSELPPYGQLADHELLKHVPPEEPRRFLKAARLRDRAEIDAARSAAETWHWRSRTRHLVENGDRLNPDENMLAAGFRTFDDIVRFTARAAAEHRTIPAAVDEDFPVQGRAYRSISAEEWAEVASITAERHFALNWLCGYAPANAWDDTPTDT